ncbi:hypothetical protein B0T21DRAFT_378263, partial [Apiosordaria backusii]
ISQREVFISGWVWSTVLMQVGVFGGVIMASMASSPTISLPLLGTPQTDEGCQWNAGKGKVMMPGPKDAGQTMGLTMGTFFSRGRKEDLTGTGMRP